MPSVEALGSSRPIVAVGLLDGTGAVCYLDPSIEIPNGIEIPMLQGQLLVPGP
jgi:hypothetical protein